MTDASLTTRPRPQDLLPLRGQRILVVEDDYVLATDAREGLRRAGAEVLGPCPSEEAALGLLEEHHPTAALVDINLGAGASFRVARALQAWGVPFVFVTGYDARVVPEEFAPVPLLEKPVEMSVVVEALGALLGIGTPVP